MDLPPGLAGFVAAQQQAQQQSMGQLQQMSTLQSLADSAARREQGATEAKRNEALRAAIAALPPEQRTKENVLPLIMQYGSPREILPLLKGKDEGSFTLGPDQTRFDKDGKPIAQAAPKAGKRERQRFDGEMVIQEEMQEDGTWKEIGRGPRFAKSVGPSVNMPQPVTPVTIQDPNDPNGTIVIDGRTRQPLGKGPKLTDRGKLENQRQFNMEGIGGVIAKAEGLLTGKDGRPMPTGSGVGAAVDWAAGLVGASPDGSTEAQELKAIAGALTAKMPRMEGPQSDKDVVMYREMAAMVGDQTVPVARRKAALDTVKELWAKYERLNPDAFAGGPPAPATPPGPPPGAPQPPAAPTGFQKGQRAKNAAGVTIEFDGQNWRPVGR